MELSLNIANLSYALTVTLAAFLIYVLSRSSKRTASRLLMLIFGCVIIWAVTNFFSDNVTNEVHALFWTRLALLGPLLLLPLFYVFVDVFPDDDESFDMKKVGLLFLLVVPFIIFIPTSLNVVSVEKVTEFGWDFTPGFLYYAFFIFLLAIFGLSLYKVFKKFRVAKGLERVQIGYFYLGFIVTVIIASFASLILPLLGVSSSSTTFIGPAATIIFLTVTSYVLIRHRLFGIRFVVGKTLSMLILAAFPFFTFYFVSYLLITIWGSVFETGAMIFSMFIAVLFSYAFVGYDKAIARYFQISFIHKGKDPRTMLRDLQRDLSQELELSKVFDIFTSYIGELYDPSYVKLVIYDEEEEIIENHSYLEEVDITNISIREVKNYLSNKEHVFFEELSEKTVPSKIEKKLINSMIENEISIIFPIRLKSGLSGLFVVGKKISLKAFSLEEINVLDETIGIFSISISRALLFTEVKHLNENLKQRVNQATKELREKVVLLEDARQKERDMMDIMGHELRTPLSIIKIKQSLLHKKALESPDDFNVHDFLDVDQSINEALDREIELLETMLSSTKIDAGKLDISMEEVKLKSIIDAAILGHKSEAEEKELDLSVGNYDKSIGVFADKIRLGEVLDNFVSNAIKYTDKGSVHLCIKENDDLIEVCVIDTGIGIPKESIKRLGEKFYRVNQYISDGDNDDDNNIVRPGGTGLGLYVNFGLIELMGGKVNVESELGKGSTFSFTIPRFTGQKTDEGPKKARNVFERMEMDKAKEKR